MDEKKGGHSANDALMNRWGNSYAWGVAAGLATVFGLLVAASGIGIPVLIAAAAAAGVGAGLIRNGIGLYNKGSKRWGAALVAAGAVLVLPAALVTVLPAAAVGILAGLGLAVATVSAFVGGFIGRRNADRAEKAAAVNATPVAGAGESSDDRPEVGNEPGPAATKTVGGSPERPPAEHGATMPLGHTTRGSGQDNDDHPDSSTA